MANEEQLSILKLGADNWNIWRRENPQVMIDLYKADLQGADLTHADLADANLAKANLGGAYFIATNLFGANLSGAYLINAEFDDVDLNCADLTGADLSQSLIRDGYISNTNLIKASLRGAYIIQTNFSGTNLNETDLTGAEILRANFDEVDFTKADLSGTIFRDVVLNKANFYKTILGFTIFSDTDISTINGLEDVMHKSSSTLGTNTLQRSKGKIPVAFLRGCGLSDTEIEFAKLAAQGLDSNQVTDITYKIHQLYLGGGIQYYSCFISYSSKDQEFAQLLHDDLQNNGVRCWFDREDLKIGDSIRPTIDRQIRLRDKLLVILSENSIKSEWVGDEVEGALEEEQKGNRSVLFPIRLDDTALNTRDDWAAKIKRRRHIGDFSNWKDKASYQKAFERLLRDLKATG